MNAETKIFRSNRSQAVRIPKALAFPDTVERVIVRREGKDIIISPKDSFWTDFFDQGPNPDFPERDNQGDFEERDSLDD